MVSGTEMVSGTAIYNVVPIQDADYEMPASASFIKKKEVFTAPIRPMRAGLDIFNAPTITSRLSRREGRRIRTIPRPGWGITIEINLLVLIW